MDPALIAAGIKAAPAIISGISSLFGGGSSESTTINYKKLRKAAEKGGFNPLTALRAGGASGFVQTHTPALASVGTLAQAAVDGFAAYRDYDPHAADNATLERELLRAQLAKIQADTKYTTRLANAPVRVGANVTTGNLPGMSSGANGLPPAEVNVQGPGGQVMDVTSPDHQMEAESDLWRWFREGRLVPELKKAAAANNWSVDSFKKELDSQADNASGAVQDFWRDWETKERNFWRDLSGFNNTNRTEGGF